MGSYDVAFKIPTRLRTFVEDIVDDEGGTASDLAERALGEYVTEYLRKKMVAAEERRAWGDSELPQVEAFPVEDWSNES